jgi:hypothetical protein
MTSGDHVRGADRMPLPSWDGRRGIDGAAAPDGTVGPVEVRNRRLFLQANDSGSR